MKRSLALCNALIILALSLGGCARAPQSLARVFGPPRHPQAAAATDRLLSSDPLLQKEAHVELISLGSGAMPDLRDAIEGATSEQRIRIIEAASRIGTPPELLVELFGIAAKDPDTTVRKTVAFRCADHKELEAALTPIVKGLLFDTAPGVQAAAITTLQEYSTRDTLPIPTIKTLLTHSDPLVVASATSLALLRSEPELRAAARAALPSLIGQLNNPSPLIRAQVIIAIGKYGPMAAPAAPPLIIVMIKDKNPAIQLQCAIALARIRSKQALEVALPALQQFASSPDPGLAIPAQQMLTQIPRPATTPPQQSL